MADDPIHLVIDANILISAFLKEATTRHLLLDERLKLYAPPDLFRETRKVLQGRLFKHLQAIPDFDQFFSLLTNGIKPWKSPLTKRMRHIWLALFTSIFLYGRMIQECGIKKL